ARWTIEKLNLYSQVDPYPEEDSDLKQSLVKKFKQWKERSEETLSVLVFFAFVLFVLYQLILTEKGNRLFDKVYSNPLGMILIWIVGGFAGIITLLYLLSLVARYRWVYHCFWLSLIGCFYFSSENQWLTGVFTAYYVASMFLPKFW